MTLRANAKSPAVRASGPMTEMAPSESASLDRAWPRLGTIPNVGLWPNTPLYAAGLRMLPPMSLPYSRPDSPAAIATADPPDDPPAVRPVSHGLLVVP